MAGAILTHQYSWDDIGTLGVDLCKRKEKNTFRSEVTALSDLVSYMFSYTGVQVLLGS